MADAARGFRLALPRDATALPRPGANPLLREALETTDLLRYARRLWSTPHDRIDFLLELPASRRWLDTTLSATYTEGQPVTLVEAHLTALPSKLTARELEVLTLVAAGHSNPTIAESLYTSPRTVSTQVETIRMKLGAISRTAAGVLASQHGWLKLPMPVGRDALGSLSVAGLVGDADERTTGADGVSSTLLTRLRPVRLGLAYPEQGLASDDGAQSRRGALLAINELNARGGIRGRLIDAVMVDADIYSAPGIRATFARLAENDVDAVLMSYMFDEATTLEEAAELGVPVLHTMTSRRHLETVRSNPQRYCALFQCAPPESNYGPGLARFLDLLDSRHGTSSTAARPLARTVRFIETTADSGQIADATTIRLLADHDWTVVGVDSLDADPTTIARLSTEILADPPTVLVVSEFLPSVLANLLLRLHAERCPSIIYTIYAPSVPEFISQMGAAAEGIVWATVSGTYSDPYGAEFRSAYRSMFGASPGLSQAGLAYDMTHIIAAAWQQSADPSDVNGTLAALRKTRYRGVNGSYNFASGLQSTVAYPEETDDPSLGNAQLIFQVQDGEHRCLGPEPYTDGEFRWLTHA